jgi:hypothetical protein
VLIIAFPVYICGLVSNVDKFSVYKNSRDDAPGHPQDGGFRENKKTAFSAVEKNIYRMVLTTLI